MINLPIKITFSLLVLVFILILIGIFIPGVGTKLFEIAGPIIVFSEWIVFLLLGAILIALTLRKKIEGPVKKFLLLTGISSVGFLVFVVLHNLVSGLLSMILNSEIEEPVFFILAVIVCPLGFIIGVIGSIIELVRQKVHGTKVY